MLGIIALRNPRPQLLMPRLPVILLVQDLQGLSPVCQEPINLMTDKVAVSHVLVDIIVPQRT